MTMVDTMIFFFQMQPLFYVNRHILQVNGHLFSLNLSQTSPAFTCLQYKSFENTVGKGEIAPSPTMFSTPLENFLPFSSNLKFLSANSFRLEVSKMCRLEKGFSKTAF